MIRTDAQTGLPYIESGGERRLLASFPSRGKMKALPHVGTAVPMLDRSKWFTLDRSKLFSGERWILDQNGVGECVGCGWSMGLDKVAHIAGLGWPKLSPAALYAQINGGRDNGAVISDAVQALQTVGTCDYATVGIKPFFTNQLPAGWREKAGQYKLGAALHANSFDEIVSALLTGEWVAVFGIMVGNNFERFDHNGVCGHDRGPGNHCIHADGVTIAPNGDAWLECANSWSTTWGPFGNGRMRIDRQHVEGGGDEPDICLIQAAARNADDTADFPVAE